MTRYGVYNPLNTSNISSLFVFQEVPLTSAKLNYWNGNLAAQFELFHLLCSALFAHSTPAVLALEDDTGLQVVPTDPESLKVIVNPGIILTRQAAAGLGEPVELPPGSFLVPPQTHPRLDVIYINTTGGVGILEGHESSEPVPPELPAGSVALAQIFHYAGSTRITASDTGSDSYIIDTRPRLLIGEAHRHAADHLPSEPPDGVRTDFSTAHPFRAGTLDVFLNGVLQEKDVDYIEHEDAQGYRFLSPPQSHYRIQHRYVSLIES